VSYPPYSSDGCDLRRTAEKDIVDSTVNDEPALTQPECVDDRHAAENTHAPHVSGFERNAQAETQPEQSSYIGYNGQPEQIPNQPPSPTQAFNSE
jgi:hypothetical protein